MIPLQETLPGEPTASPALSPSQPIPHVPLSPMALALGGALLTLLGALFTSRILALAHVWSVDDTYSHGFLVPLISVYLTWEILNRQKCSRAGSVAGGFLWLGIGSVFHVWAQVVDWALIDFVALGTILYGLSILVGGRTWANNLAFPILFLVFMFPLPPFLTDGAAVWLQGIVTQCAEVVLSFLYPVARTGSILSVAGHRLEVGEACSGLRQLIAFLALALLVAHYSDRGFVFRSAIVLSALPVAIAANVLRVMLMALITVNFGVEWISEERFVPVLGFSYHTGWGLVTMVAGLVLFLGVRWWLTKAFPAPSKSLADSEPVQVPQGPTPGFSLGGLVQAVGQPDLVRPYSFGLAFVGVTLLAHLVMQSHLQAAQEAGDVRLTRPLAEFSHQLGPWVGKSEDKLDAATQPYYDSADDRLSRTYHPGPNTEDMPEELACRVFMVHFRDGSDRRHHPQICYSVLGFREDVGQHEAVEMPGHPAKAQRFCFTRQDARSYVYYWHYTLEPVQERRLSSLQSIHLDFGVRRPSLTVQVYTNALAPSLLEKSNDFARLVDQELQKHLPPGARRGSHVMSVKHVH